jgi:hypothetical protein
MTDAAPARDWRPHFDLTAFPEGALRTDTERALDDLVQDDEAWERIQYTAQGSASGRVHLENDDEMITSITFEEGNVVINISMIDSAARYYSPQAQQLCDFSIQEALFHELSHYYRGHLTEIANETDPLSQNDLIQNEIEPEAIKDTNAFRKRFGGRPPRITDEVNYIREKGRFPGDQEGTPAWDYVPALKTTEGALTNTFNACRPWNEIDILKIPEIYLERMRSSPEPSPQPPPAQPTSSPPPAFRA